MSPNDTTAILGLGHIDSPTALGLAEFWWRVIGAQNDAGKVKLIRAGRATSPTPSDFDVASNPEFLREGSACARVRISPGTEMA